MKIQSVAVLGAGAVGSYVIWGLSNRKDIRLGVIAKGERASLSFYGVYPGRNVEQISPECMQQSSTGDSWRGSRMLPGQCSYESDQ